MITLTVTVQNAEGLAVRDVVVTFTSEAANGTEVGDFTSGYRMYRVSMLQKATAHWGDRLIEEDGFACMVELLLKLRHWKPQIVEVPMKLRYDRKLGESKLNLPRTLRQYLKLALRDRLTPAPREARYAEADANAVTTPS